jgi:hypothetical protein
MVLLNLIEKENIKLDYMLDLYVIQVQLITC